MDEVFGKVPHGVTQGPTIHASGVDPPLAGFHPSLAGAAEGSEQYWFIVPGAAFLALPIPRNIGELFQDMTGFPVSVRTVELPVPFVDGLVDRSHPKGPSYWNTVLLAIPRDVYNDVLHVLGSIAVHNPRNNRLARVRTQSLLLRDPISMSAAVMKNNDISTVPFIKLDALVVETNVGSFVYTDRTPAKWRLEFRPDLVYSDTIDFATAIELGHPSPYTQASNEVVLPASEPDRQQDEGHDDGRPDGGA